MLNGGFLWVGSGTSRDGTGEVQGKIGETGKVGGKMGEGAAIAIDFELTRRFNRPGLLNLTASELGSSVIAAVKSGLALLSTTRGFSARSSGTLVMPMTVFDSELSRQC